MQLQLYSYVLLVHSEKKNYDQIVLKGALHLTDYVTKVMKRLSDQNISKRDPKVVLAFVLLQKKTYDQIVLKGALHLTDYVTKVMERLSDESVDPKVVLEFVHAMIVLIKQS